MLGLFRSIVETSHGSKRAGQSTMVSLTLESM